MSMSHLKKSCYINFVCTEIESGAISCMSWLLSNNSEAKVVGANGYIRSEQLVFGVVFCEISMAFRTDITDTPS